MPKSSKKKKDKAADFTKAKLKLGKGKQLANNAIDTSFKARSIALPTQTIAVEKDGSNPLTKRHLSFTDLISHLKHYNANTRKDAILGLRELFEAHWDLVGSNLTVLINAVVRVIGDEDAGVRKTLLTFFSWLIPRIPSENLIPHAHLLVLFTTSAQTHIFPEIRIDAVRFLDIYLESIPQVVVSGFDEATKGHGSRVLEGYLGLLNAGTKFGGNDGPPTATSNASIMLTAASKLVVLNSLSTFLGHALRFSDKEFGGSIQEMADPNKPMAAWFLKNAFRTQGAFLEFEQLLQPQHAQKVRGQICQSWREWVDHEEDDDDFVPSFPLAGPSSLQHWTLQDVTNVSEDPIPLGSVGFSSDSNISLVGHLAQTLHSSLIATFLDHAPAAFSPSSMPSETEVDLELAVCRIIHTLYESLLQESEKVPGDHIQGLKSLLDYMTPYFPAYSPGGKSVKLGQFYEEFNLIYCELTSMFVITSKGESSRASRRRKAREGPSALTLSKRNGQASLLKQAEGVSDFVVQRLKGRASSSEITSTIGPATYLTLLPTIWTLINHLVMGEDQQANEMLLVTLEHALKAPSKGAVKRLTVEFISRLILLDTHPQYRGIFKVGRNAIEDQKIELWFLHLPQVLWELGNANLLTTETILRALLRILHRRSRLIQVENIPQLQARMVPYFTINHAVRGQLPGQYQKLPAGSSIRLLALDVVATLQSRGRPASDSMKLLSSAVCQAVEGTAEEKYWQHVAINFL